MALNNIDIGLSFHLQKDLGQLIQKWPSYGHFHSDIEKFFLNVFPMLILKFAYLITLPYVIFQGATVKEVMEGKESTPPRMK